MSVASDVWRLFGGERTGQVGGRSGLGSVRKGQTIHVSNGVKVPRMLRSHSSPSLGTKLMKVTQGKLTQGIRNSHCQSVSEPPQEPREVAFRRGVCRRNHNLNEHG